MPQDIQSLGLNLSNSFPGHFLHLPYFLKGHFLFARNSEALPDHICLPFG